MTMTAAACLKKAIASGVDLYVEAGRLRGLGARPEPELAATLREHEAEIVTLLASRESAAMLAGPGQETVPQVVPPATSAPSGNGAVDNAAEYQCRQITAKEVPLVAPIPPIEAAWPEPKITKVPCFAFGADQMPHRYRRAWRELLKHCPEGMSEWQWAQAIYDARDLFATWGAKIEEMHWSDDDIFERPNGLIWFLRGEYVTFPGDMTAHTSGRRIWRRPRQRPWPTHAGLFARVKDDGRAEAALIAAAGLLRKGANP